MPPKNGTLQPENVLRFGPFEVHPERNLITGPEGDRTVESKMMQVLLLLVEESGRVVSREKILDQAWPDTFVGDEVVWRSISELRKVLGDDPKNPQYLETVPRKGYRWLVPVTRTEAGSPSSVLTGSLSNWYSGKHLLPSAFILLSGLLAIWLFVLKESPSSVGSTDEDAIWVLIAEAEGSAEKEYGEILRHSLEIALGQSRRVRLAAPERVVDALSLMRLGPETTVTMDVGRKVCVRDGGIDLVVAAGVDQDEDGFLMRVLLVDPATGDPIAAHQEESPAETGILKAVQRLSDWTRQTLGEEVKSEEASGQGLEKATTGSLEALRLYSQAMRLGYLWEWGPAERLLWRSIEEDPTFASAQVMLAWAIRNQIPPVERLDRLSEYSEPARLALECPISWEIFALAADLLAEAWEAQGSKEEAVRVLERALQRKFVVGRGAASRWPLWQRLLRLYKQGGEQTKRVELAQRIRHSLRTADEDHPLLQATEFVE